MDTLWVWRYGIDAVMLAGSMLSHTPSSGCSTSRKSSRLLMNGSKYVDHVRIKLTT